MLIGNAVGLSHPSLQENILILTSLEITNKTNFQPTDVQLLMNIEQQSTGHQSQI